MKKITLVVLIILLFASTGLAANWYVDSACEHNGDGTGAACADSDGETGAYNQIPESWFISNDNDRIFFRRGRIYDWSKIHHQSHQRIIIDGNNVVVDAYGEGDMPEIINYFDYQDTPPSCSVVEANVWFCETDADTVSNPPYILGLGDNWEPAKQRQYYNNNANQPIDEPGEWDYQSHSTDGPPNGFYIFSPNTVNPFDYYGSIHYQTSQNWTIRTRRGSNVTIRNIKFSKGSKGVYVTNITTEGTKENITIKNCIFDACFYGIIVFGYDEAQITKLNISYNRFLNILNSPVHISGPVGNSLIEYNYINHAGYGTSTGGFYIGNHSTIKPDPGFTIRFNECTDYHYGEYWPDGACFYLDEGTSHNKVYYNYAHDTARAYMDHTSEDNLFYYNSGLNIGQGMRLSARDTGSGNTVGVYNNSFVNCGHFNYFVPGKPANNNTCILATTNYGDNYFVKNNLMTANENAMGGLGANDDTETQVIGDSSNNLIYGFDYPGLNTSHNSLIDLTGKAIFLDPLLTGYHIPYNSPAINAGTVITGIHNAWPDWTKDIDGDFVVNNAPDIGCDEYRIRPTIGSSLILDED